MMDHNVLAWLERSAERNADKTAVADPDMELTYEQLLVRAQSAGMRLAEDIKIADPVVFYMEKSALALCGMLGAVYAGGFYSFLDVRQPAARAVSILRVLQPKVIVTDAKCADAAEKLMQLLAETREWESESADEVIEGEPAVPQMRMPRLLHVEELTQPMEGMISEGRMIPQLAHIRSECSDIQPLYVNFTSGSTGMPKGVVVSHRSVLEFIDIFVETFGLAKEDVFANQAPFDFDVSVKDIYSCLAVGAKLLIIPREYFSSPTKLMDYLADGEATVLVWAVSAMCFVSVMNGFEYRTPKQVRKVMFSGEVLPVKHLHVWQQALPEAEFVNLYGPTEITCNCTYHVLEGDYSENGIIPIGKPFANEKVFLLDEEDRLVTQPGVPGELCVCGTSLALGYYRDPERTAQVFVLNPLNTEYPETMYRTGDLARYDEQGELVYISRKDFQIKHLGHRIELGEIESNVTACEGITRSCCLYDTQRQRLILFYTGDREKRSLMKELRTSLPPYMLPNQMFPIEEMPLNKNGKIDRKQLMAQYHAQS